MTPSSSIPTPISPTTTPSPFFPHTLQELQQLGLWENSLRLQPKEVILTCQIKYAEKIDEKNLKIKIIKQILKDTYCSVKTVFKDVWRCIHQFGFCVLRGPLSPQPSRAVCSSPVLRVPRASILSFLIKIWFKFIQEAPTTLTGRPLLVRQVFHRKSCGSLISQFLYLNGLYICRDISSSLIKIFCLGQWNQWTY